MTLGRKLQKNNPTVLVRKSLDVENEASVISKHFDTTYYRSQIAPNSLVIGRYSCLPFYKELEEELALNNSCLINSFNQHTYIADAKNWIHDIPEYTPKTYDNWYNLPEGSYIVKGSTNSRKSSWHTHMFAPTKDDVQIIAERLMDDQFIFSQGLIIREYIPLVTFDYAINGLPITNEWRFFFYKENMLSYGWYWSSHIDVFEEKNPQISSDGILFAEKIAKIISKNTNFFVLDVAETLSGDWIVIEVNDGSQSGLSMSDPDVLFGNLKIILENENLDSPDKDCQ